MAQVHLISAGKDVKIWKVGEDESSKVKTQIKMVSRSNPHESTYVSCVEWSFSNQYIFTCAEDGTFGLMHRNGAKAGETYSISDMLSKNATKSSKLKLHLQLSPSSSRIMSMTGIDQSVRLYDVKLNKIVHAFTGHSALTTCSSWNIPKGDRIASGNENGDILIHCVRTGKLVSHLRLPKTHTDLDVKPHSQAIRDLQFSPHKSHRNLVAAAYESGCVRLWDVTTGTEKASFLNLHEAPVMCLAFSPVNDALLVSAGLDKKLVFSSITTTKVMKSIELPSPISCVAINRDGVTFAVGTMAGEIVLFDLRAGSIPVSTVNAHGPFAVRSLKFERPPKVTSASSTQPSQQQQRQQLRSSTSSVMTTPTTKIETTDNQETCREPTRPFSESLPARTTTSTFRPAPRELTPEQSAPLSTEVKYSQSRQRSVEASTAARRPLSDTSSATKNTNQYTHASSSVSNSNNPRSNIVTKVSKIEPDISDLKKKPKISILNHLSNNNQHLPPKETTRSDRNDFRTNVSQKKTSSQLPSSEVTAGMDSSSKHNVPRSPELDDKLDSIRNEMWEGIQNLQIDMCRQFQNQQSVLATMFGTLENELQALRQENQELRNENQTLKNVY